MVAARPACQASKFSPVVWLQLSRIARYAAVLSCFTSDGPVHSGKNGSYLPIRGLQALAELQYSGSLQQGNRNGQAWVYFVRNRAHRWGFTLMSRLHSWRNACGKPHHQLSLD